MTIAKIFLDKLYNDRFEIKSKISDCEEKRRQPMYQCCEKMHHTNIYGERLKMYEEQLSIIDETIKSYIKSHTGAEVK